MATRSNKRVAATQQPEEKNVKGPVRCMACKHGLLHRYGNNPILAACMKQPQSYDERFPYQIEVASCLRHCAMYAEATEVKEVEQRSKAA